MDYLSLKLTEEHINLRIIQMTTLLFVDDDLNICQMSTEFLTKSGFSVDCVHSGRDALKQLYTRPYDAIISDYEMEEMDGITLLKIVRKEIGEIPFILLTGKGREDVLIDAINNGADYYLQKSLNILSLFTELMHKINQAVEQSRTRKL